MPRPAPRFEDCVFINCPFDEQYWPLFEAIVFCVLDCGFAPRCALEDADAGEVRFAKICRLIGASRFGIHDISRVEVSGEAALPRFNMPLELGLDLGSRLFGSTRRRTKKPLALDSVPYRYQAAISDIAGQDIRAHGDSPDGAIGAVRHWLATAANDRTVPPASAVRRRFLGFTSALPRLCDTMRLDRDDLQFVEYVALAESWLTTPTG